MIKAGDNYYHKKTVEVKARAGSEKMVVKFFPNYKSSYCYTKTVEPGKEMVFEFEGTDKYEVKEFWAEEQVDCETWSKKTGTLQGARGLKR